MKVQKKTKAILLLLLPLWAWTTHCFGQLNLNSAPDDYMGAIQIIHDVYGDDIQVSLSDIHHFMDKAVSDLPYDSNWATPDARLTYRSQGQFTLNWALINKADNYRISTLDLGNNAKNFTNNNAPPHQGSFYSGDGPTLIVVQAENFGFRSSTLDFIIIDKIIMYINFDYACDCPGYQFTPVASSIGNDEYQFPLYGYELSHQCPKTVHMLNVNLDAGGGEFNSYSVFWELDFSNNSIALSDGSCGVSLIPNLVEPNAYAESLISDDGALLIYIDSEQVSVSPNGDGSIADANLFTCCNKIDKAIIGKKLGVLPPASDPLSQELAVTPNPSYGQMNIAYRLEEIQDVQLQLFSSEGLVLQAWQFTAQASGQQNHDLDLDNHPAGIYYLALKTTKNKQIQKVVLLR
ncbi:MAG: T9SS type A sorting domain-containing protein [Bacteroidota bacterium]